MCRVFSCVVGRGCLLWPVHSLGRTLLVFALLHSIFQAQICLLPQVFLDFLLLHSTFWQNMVHWRRDWQTSSIFLSWEPHEQYVKAKVGSQETPGVTGKFGLGVQNEAGQRLIEFCQEKLPTTQEKTAHMMEKLSTVSKNKTRNWLWLRSWTPYCQIQT